MKLHSKKTVGVPAVHFELLGADDRSYSFKDLMGERGLVVAFICNHCPYVQAIIDRMVQDAKTLQAEGFGFVAISSNDVETYPQDGFEFMKEFAQEHDFTFPYLYDETQAVARAYDAVCTPDIFGISSEGVIQYRGRLDAGRGLNAPAEGTPRDLVEAMRMIAKTGEGPAEQFPSIGCSIKWVG